MEKRGPGIWRWHPHTEHMYNFAIEHGTHSAKLREKFYELAETYVKRFDQELPRVLWPSIWEQAEREVLE